MASQTEQAVQAYLDTHKIQQTVEDAINAAVKADSKDPAAFMAAHLAGSKEAKREREPAADDANGVQRPRKESPIAALRCGFVGTGTMSAAMVRGLCTANPPVASVAVSPRNAEKAAALAREFPGRVTVAADNQDVVERSDVVFIGVLGPVVEETVRGLRFEAGRHTVISLVAAAKLDSLREWCAPLAPEAVIRAIPLPPVAKHAHII